MYGEGWSGTKQLHLERTLPYILKAFCQVIAILRPSLSHGASSDYDFRAKEWQKPARFVSLNAVAFQAPSAGVRSTDALCHSIGYNIMTQSYSRQFQFPLCSIKDCFAIAETYLYKNGHMEGACVLGDSKSADARGEQGSFGKLTDTTRA